MSLEASSRVLGTTASTLPPFCTSLGRGAPAASAITYTVVLAVQARRMGGGQVRAQVAARGSFYLSIYLHLLCGALESCGRPSCDL